MTHPDEMIGLDADDAAELALAIEEVSRCARHLLRSKVLLDQATEPEDIETYLQAAAFWDEQLAGALRERDAWQELIDRA